jgi:hypothetical protein
MKASADTRLMRGTGLVPELFRIGSEVGIVSETRIGSTVGFEINSVVGSGILTELGSDTVDLPKDQKKCHHWMVTLPGWPKQTECYDFDTKEVLTVK